VDRRDFLKLTLAAGGAVALAPVLGTETEAAAGSLHGHTQLTGGQYQPACVRCANGPLHVRDAEGNPRLFWPKAGVVRLGPDGEIRLEEQRCSPGNCERVTARRQWAQTVESRPPW